MTITLIGICVAVAVGGAARYGSVQADGTVGDFGLNIEFLAIGEWWRLLTSGFLHAGLVHLGVNMFSLWRLGIALEQRVGRLRFALLYLASLLAGSTGVVLLQRYGVQARGLHAGASGAIFGLLGALAVDYRIRGISLMQSGMGPTLIMNIFLTFTFGLSIGGHLGGFVGGTLCGLAFFGRGHIANQSIVGPLAVSALSVALAVGAVLSM